MKTKEEILSRIETNRTKRKKLLPADNFEEIDKELENEIEVLEWVLT